MPAAIIGGVIAGAAGIGGALISSHAVGQASGDALQAAQENNALQQQIYNSNVALAQPYINAGTSALPELEGFLGLGGDPAKIKQAFKTYLDSTGYKFDFNQGIGAINQDQAARGLLDSGATLKSLDQFGTGLANQFGQQYVGNLQSLADTGQRAAGSLTGAGQAYANAVSANNNSAASAAGNAAIAGANIDTSLIGNALNAYGMLRGQSSFGGGGANAFNAFTGANAAGG